MRLPSLLLAVSLGGALLGQPTPQAPPEDIPGAEFVFEEIVTLAPVVKVGKTFRGVRQYIPITGGTFQGKLKGKILPGGWDWQLTRPDGCTDVEASYFIQVDDGTIIHVLNKGELCSGGQGAPRTHPVFEAPEGPHAWLNQAAFVGTLGPANIPGQSAVKIRFYRLK